MPKAESSGFCNMNLIQMEITMNLKRAFLTLVVLMMLPALAQAATVRFDTSLLWLDTDLVQNNSPIPEVNDKGVLLLNRKCFSNVLSNLCKRFLNK